MITTRRLQCTSLESWNRGSQVSHCCQSNFECAHFLPPSQCIKTRKKKKKEEMKLKNYVEKFQIFLTTRSVSKIRRINFCSSITISVLTISCQTFPCHTSLQCIVLSFISKLAANVNVVERAIVRDKATVIHQSRLLMFA